jgi:hypothetical protein
MRIVSGFAMLTLIAVFLLLASGDGNQLPRSTSAESILKRQAWTSRDSITTTNALTMALSTAGVPGGIATLTQCGEDAKYMFAPTGATLKDVLNGIVSTNPEYTWQLNHGVVNVFPLNGEPALLQQNVRSLDVREAVSIHEIVRQVLSRPELQKRIAQLHLSEGYKRIGMSDLKRPGSIGATEPRYSLRLKNVTLREALNAIAVAHGKAVWEYRERHCNGGAEFQLQFLVR